MFVSVKSNNNTIRVYEITKKCGGTTQSRPHIGYAYKQNNKKYLN